MKNFIKALIFASVALWAQTDPLNMTTMQVVKDMGLGINLGNTMEATIVCNPGDNGCENWVNSMETLETSWGSPQITNAIVKGYADAGFKIVRIPVAWSNKMTGDNAGGTYTISPALMNRVEQIVNYVLSNGMYAIVNIHWDGGWWEKFPIDSAECMRKYTRIWEQISTKFKDKSGYLIFESLNEEGVWDNIEKTRAYEILNAINKEFTNLIRASGGNNENRHLLIAGYATDIDKTIDPLFKMPTDSKNRQAVSVHYYDPFGFTHSTNDPGWTSWAPVRMNWGTEQDYTELNTAMSKLKTNFVEKNIPVIVGEYGFASDLARPVEEIRKYTLAVANAIYSRDMCPVLWDTQRDEPHYYNRKSNPPAFVDQQLVAGLKNIIGVSSSSSNQSSSSSNAAYSSSSSSLASSSSAAISSSSSSNLASSSSNNKTPITNHSPLTTSNSPTYYSLKGEPLGNAKPQKAGVYIVKQGNSIRKIAVR